MALVQFNLQAPGPALAPPPRARRCGAKVNKNHLLVARVLLGRLEVVDKFPRACPGITFRSGLHQIRPVEKAVWRSISPMNTVAGPDLFLEVGADMFEA